MRTVSTVTQTVTSNVLVTTVCLWLLMNKTVWTHLDHLTISFSYFSYFLMLHHFVVTTDDAGCKT